MLRVFLTVFAGLLGLCFGSFLNVCLSRWPEGESVVQPRSRCMSCGRILAWWENIPLASWVALRGRCRTCSAWIGWRYPLVECAMGSLWAWAAWRGVQSPHVLAAHPLQPFLHVVGAFVFYWLLVALAVFDAEHFWLPDLLTFSGIATGFLLTTAAGAMDAGVHGAARAALRSLLAIVLTAVLLLVMRGAYRMARHREGIGLGDVKLMAMLAAWLGIAGTLVAFALSVALAVLAALVLLATAARKGNTRAWLQQKIPFGTFLCVGGALSAFCGRQILAAYRTWAGL